MIAPGFELHAKQQLALTPRLQQSVKLLQLSALEFTREIEQAIANNPFLEEADPHAPDGDAVADGAAGDSAGVNAEPVANAELTTVVDEADGFRDDADGDPQDGDYGSGDFGNREYGALGNSGGGDDDGDPADWNHALPSLREHLHAELGLYLLNQRDRALCEMVIEALDDDGYLRQDLQELAAQIFPPPIPGPQELSAALKRVQQLDSPGIGARSVVECLSLQLLALPDADQCADRDLALRIVNEQMALLARHDRNALQRALGCDAAQLQRACALIRKLDPRPGLRFGRGEQGYVVPDVLVRKVRGQWAVQINQAVLPKARLNRMYADMFHQSRCGSRSPLALKLQEARWLIRNAEQRFTTIQRVAEAIVEHQRHFFEYGDVALRPLVLRDLAEELELHESTISRATGNKFMATPRGIFEFKHFFSRQLATESGGTCSSASVRAMLKELIDGEDLEAPLSDVDLTRLLAEQGVIVARRTVAKYRGLMRVPPAELRRQVS